MFFNGGPQTAATGQSSTRNREAAQTTAMAQQGDPEQEQHTNTSTSTSKENRRERRVGKTPQKVEGQMVGGPEGWRLEGWGPEGQGFQGWRPEGWGPKISRFFFFLPLEISLFVVSLGVFSWIEVQGPSKVHVWSSLGHRVRAPAALSGGAPGRAQTCILEGPCFQKKLHRNSTRRRPERENTKSVILGRGGRKKSEILCGPAEVGQAEEEVSSGGGFEAGGLREGGSGGGVSSARESGGRSGKGVSCHARFKIEK